MNLKSGFPFSLIRYGMPYQYPKLLSPVKKDVVIIGGGISGALMATYLVDAGIDCMVVDGRSIGLGSTCASTSLIQYEIDVSLTELSEKIGNDAAVSVYRLCEEAILKLKELATIADVSEFKANKSVYYAAYKKHLPFLKDEYKARKAAGLRVAFLDEQDLSERFGFTAPGAILSQEAAYADAYIFTHALHQFNIKKGLEVYDRTFIKNISDSGRQVKLVTDDNITITARKVIHATGYEVTDFIRKKIVTLHSTYTTISEHLSQDSALLKKNIMLWNTDSPYLYIRGTKDGRMIVGGRDEKFFNPSKRDKLINRKSQLLVSDFRKLFPEIEFKPEFSWAGTFGTTLDGLPFIGQYPQRSNHYFALGFGGNGITFSLLAAEIITDLICGRANSAAKFFSFERA